MKTVVYLMIVILVAMVICIAGFDIYSRYIFRWEWEKRNEVVDLYLKGQLHPKANGLLELPAFLLTDSERHAYVTERGRDRFVLFCTWRGKGGNLAGYLYSSDTSFKVGKAVSINRPTPRGIAEERIPIVGNIDVGWYHVLYNLD